MSDTIKPIGMPKWGLAMTEGKVNTWLVEEGAAVSVGDEIVEIETSKITNVFESPVSGVLRRRVATEGETLPVGALLGVVADPAVSDADIDAFVSRYKEEQSEAAAAEPPPEPELVKAGDWTVRVLRVGEQGNIPLLLIHGFGGDLTNWQFNQPALAEERAVYAIDLPGHGGSSKTVPGGDVATLASMVRSAMDALEIRRVHLVGHSLGGAVALRIALDEPDRVASVTMIGTAGLGPDINMDYVEGFIRAERRKEMKQTVEVLFADPSLVSRDMVEDLLRYKRLDGVLTALRTIADGAFPGGRQGALLAERIQSLDIPVQAIWGQEDRVIPASHADTLPEGRRHILTGAGHMVHIERAEDVNRLISEFVAFAGG